MFNKKPKAKKDKKNKKASGDRKGFTEQEKADNEAVKANI